MFNLLLDGMQYNVIYKMSLPAVKNFELYFLIMKTIQVGHFVFKPSEMSFKWYFQVLKNQKIPDQKIYFI